MTAKIPRDKENDYTRASAESRRQFLVEQTNAKTNHVEQFSFEPTIFQGNIENFIGVAQVPIGLAGPLLVNGEFAKGEFFVPPSPMSPNRPRRQFTRKSRRAAIIIFRSLCRL